MSEGIAGAVLADTLKEWQPGSVETTRRVDPWAAEAFAGLIGTPAPPPLAAGDALPPMWHWFTLLDHPAQSEIGMDGHPADGPFLPPIPRRRRMFAGGRLRQGAPIPVGAQLSSHSSVAGVKVKSGRSGDLAFVTVRHELAVDGTAVGVEEQDIVYRSEPDSAARRSLSWPEKVICEADQAWRLELVTDPVLLFRFSALTYNGHRIHYDWPYATQVERYPGLVVHGPLLALLALELPRVYAPGRAVRAFDYRLVRPAFAPSLMVSKGRRDGSTAEIEVGAEDSRPSLTARVGLE
jgi:3-methylfumaryl-CoA hydratase